MYTKISFNKKPISIPAEYRPMYQIGLIAIILAYSCRANSSSLLKLHLLSWSLYSTNNMNVLQSYLKNKNHSNFPHWTVDPVLNRALHLGIAEGLFVRINTCKYQLTKKGKDFVEYINSDKSLFSIEKEFLLSLGKIKITDEFVNKFSI